MTPRMNANMIKAFVFVIIMMVHFVQSILTEAKCHQDMPPIHTVLPAK